MRWPRSALCIENVLAGMLEGLQRFLVVRLSSIGDIVHALPAVTALGEAFPQAELHWAIESRYACLLEANPVVRRVIALDTLGWRQRPTSGKTTEDMVRTLLDLRETVYDAAIDFQGLYKSGLVAFLSRSRERLGFSELWLREPTVGVFYTERVAPHGRRHVIEMNLALVERLGVPAVGRGQWQFPLPGSRADDDYLDRQLAALGTPEFVLLNPGGGWQSKRWAPENYVELGRRLDAEIGWSIILTGSSDEEDLIRTIRDYAGSARAHYVPTTLSQFVALARRARLFVGGDTGPLHLAAAVRTPIVAIYAATETLNTPERNGPFSPADIVLLGRDAGRGAFRNQTPGYLQGVSVNAVVAAVRERLARAYG